MDRRKLARTTQVKIKTVAFFGYADAKPDSALYQEAFKLARVLAEEGLTIVNGGGPGVMDASTKGAESVGGETLAVTFYPESAPGFEGRYVGNIVDVEVRTENYIERMFKLMEHGDIYIIFNGGTGTISELGTAWVLARLYYGHHKPFLLYGKFWEEIIECIMRNMKMRGNETNVFEIVNSPEEVLAAIKKFEETMSQFDHSHCRVCKERAFMT
jgi:uncharacterized protein (TIGR00725 family)